MSKKNALFLLLFFIFNCEKSEPGWKKREVVITFKSGTESETVDSLFTSVYNLKISIKNVTLDKTINYDLWVTKEGSSDYINFSKDPFKLPIEGSPLDDSTNPALTVGVLSDADGNGENDSYNPLYSYQFLFLEGYMQDGTLCFSSKEASSTFELAANSESGDAPEDLKIDLTIERNSETQGTCKP